MSILSVGFFELFLMGIFVLGTLSGVSCMTMSCLNNCLISDIEDGDIETSGEISEEPLPLYNPPEIKPPEYALIV